MDTGQRHLVVASHNPVKLAAAEGGLRRLLSQKVRDLQLTVEGVGVPSGVADQPMSDAETLRGARNRAHGARKRVPGADFWVGLEGGLEDHDGMMIAFAWVVVLGNDPRGRLREGQSRTATFELPPPVAQLVRQGLELGDADDRVFGRQNSKQGAGAVGLLTDNVLDRRGLYEPAVMLAWIPWLRPELYDVDSAAAEGLTGEAVAVEEVPSP